MSLAAASAFEGRGLLVRLRQQNFFVKLFDAPAVFGEAARQPIEQLRMRRRTAVKFQIIGAGHDSGAEMICPMRFAMARENSGLPGLAIHSASFAQRLAAAALVASPRSPLNPATQVGAPSLVQEWL